MKMEAKLHIPKPRLFFKLQGLLSLYISTGFSAKEQVKEIFHQQQPGMSNTVLLGAELARNKTPNIYNLKAVLDL